MNLVAIVFSVVTIAVHLIVFVVESFLWLKPVVHERLLGKLDSSIDVTVFEQAQILQVLFFNQGFYNLFVALAGIVGFVLYRAGNKQGGIALISYMCAFALGAGLVLAYSTTAYTGAVVQALPPFLALLGFYSARQSK